MFSTDPQNNFMQNLIALAFVDPILGAIAFV
jgi:hypothetical protein